MAVPQVTPFVGTVSTAAGTTSTITTPNQVIPAGTVVFLLATRASLASNACGVASVSGAGAGNTWEFDALSNRAGQTDVVIARCVVVNAIAANTVLTVTWNAGSNRKLLLGAAVSGLVGTKHVGSETAANSDGSVSSGANGNNTSPSASSLTPSTVSPVFVIGGFSGGSAGGNLTAGTNLTKLDQVTTAGGSSDKTLAGVWRINTSAPGTRTATGTWASTVAWAAAMAAYTIVAPSQPTGLTLTPASDSVGATWAAVSGATGYRVRINGGAETDVGDTLTHTFGGLQPETAYTVEVQSYDSLQSSSWASVGTTTLPAPAGSPVFVHAGAGELTPGELIGVHDGSGDITAAGFVT